MSIPNFTDLRPFRFWCQKVLPLTYDDSLSYYELLCKVVDYLNKTMQDVDVLADYVEHYFDNLNVSAEVDAKLDEMASDGTLEAIVQMGVQDAVDTYANTQLPPVVTSWLDEHITQPTTPVIDSSLTISGAAADAKATGDKIARLEWSVAPVFSNAQQYYAGDYVIYNDWLWQYNVNHSPGEWDESEVTFKRIMNVIKDSGTTAIVAPQYSGNVDYQYGDYTTNNNKLWKHKTNATGWDEVTVMPEVKAKEQEIAPQFVASGVYQFGDYTVDQNHLWRKLGGGWTQTTVADELNGIRDQISNGVKWIALGDSITQGVYSEFDGGTAETLADRNKAWCKTVADILGYALDNKGVGGAGWVMTGVEIEKNLRQYIDTKTDGTNYDIDFTQYDLCTIMAGVNDWRWSEPFGTFADDISTGGTCYSNMRYVIEAILTRNPNIRIVVISPINTYSVVSGTPTKANNWGIGFTVNSKTLEDMFDLEQTVCEYYGIEFVDVLHTSIVNRENIQTVLPDKLHPSEYAHKQLGRQIARRI